MFTVKAIITGYFLLSALATWAVASIGSAMRRTDR